MGANGSLSHEPFERDLQLVGAGNTWGTRLLIARQGVKVGSDEFGNTYYEQSERHAHKSMLGRPRRWVTYKDSADPTKIGADWHGWLHHTVELPPYERKLSC